DLAFEIDGTGVTRIQSEVCFFDQMLTLMTKHGLFDLTVNCKGDLDVDQHHTVEDIGIVLGQAFNKSICNKEGINRYATVTSPMDEALSTTSIDISGSPYLVYHSEGVKDKIGDFDTELGAEFFQVSVSHAQVTRHIHLASGKNSHHI